MLRRDADLADSRETLVGTPNTFAPLSALQRKEMVLLHLTGMSPPETGSVSYRIHFANPVSDADASNDSPALHLRYRLTAETMDSAGAAPRWSAWTCRVRWHGTR